MPQPYQVRGNRITAIETYIKMKKETTIEDVIRFALRQWRGLTRRTIMSYIEDLVMAGIIKLNNNHVICIEEAEK